MKKTMAMLLVLGMTISSLTGCGSGETGGQQNMSDSAATETTAASGPTAEKPMILKFGNSSAPDKLGSVVMEKFCENVTERTGVAGDEDRYAVFFGIFASNIMPEITVVERWGEG